MRVAPLALLLAVLATGCRDTDEHQIQLDSNIIVPDTSPTMVRVTGTMVDTETESPIEGIEVCRLEDGQKGQTCTTTNTDGFFDINVPAQTKTGIFVTGTGFRGAFFPLWLTGGMGTGNWGVFNEAKAANDYAAVGLTWPPSTAKGSLAVNGTVGATIGDLPAAGTGPVYYGSNLEPDPAGQAMVGPAPLGVFYDVTPGTYDIEVALAGKTCKVFRGVGWPSDSKTLQVQIFAGFATATIVHCQ
jgi:hypothetical protein